MTFGRFAWFSAALIFACASHAQIPEELKRKFQELPAEQQSAILSSGAISGGGSATLDTNPSDVLGAAASGEAQSPPSVSPAPAPVSGLMRFGYELFLGGPKTFAPASDIPVPQEYVVGPGDAIEIQLYGKENARFQLTVQRDGAVLFPELGPIQVAGLKFDDAKTVLNNQISKKMIGTSSAISLGALRSIRVFILGDARQPGAYTVSSLSTITNALFVSGGIAETGSLRRVELKRHGRVVAKLDLYDLLLRGDTSRDVRLQPGDVLFIPPVGMTVGVSGGVRRPAIYEVSPPISATELITLAGGVLPNAEPAKARIDRINEGLDKSVIDLNLARDGSSTLLRNGDVLRLPNVQERLEGVVFLKGHVNRPDTFTWRPGMTVADVLPGPEAFRPLPDLDSGLIIREDPVDRTLKVERFNPRQSFAAGGDALALQPRDAVHVFGLAESRSEQLGEVLSSLKLQGRKSGADQVVRVKGQVHLPGEYPLHGGMTVSDLLSLALNLTADADRDYALLVREDSVSHEISLMTVNFGAILKSHDAAQDLQLSSDDTLLVFSARESREELLKPYLQRLSTQARYGKPSQIVRVSGEVRFPGAYPITKKMQIADLIGIAGGLAEPAYAHTALLSRATADQVEGYSVKPIEVSLVEGADSTELQPDDTLQIKRLPGFRKPSTVTLKGEFLFPGEYRVQEGETLSQLIARVGGLNEQAYAKASFFVRESLKEKERQRLELQKEQLKKDLVRLQLQAASESSPELKEGVAVTGSLVDQLSGARATGRLVIDLPLVLKARGDADIVLEDGDVLTVGKKPDSVSVYGEVLYPSTQKAATSASVKSYLNRSGGVTRTADADRAYIVRANGEIVSNAIGFLGMGARMQPGDTLVVPYDIARLDKVKLTSNVVQIIAQLAITAASLSAVGAF